MPHLKEYIRENDPRLQAPLREIERSSRLAMMVMATLGFVLAFGVEILGYQLKPRKAD